MKTISILRHAKAERPDAYPNDFERPLTERGHKDAQRLGALIAQLEPPVDYVVSSSAMRAAQTADRVASTVGYKKPIVWQEAIYLAASTTLLETLQTTPEAADHVLIVGHNPGLEELASGLCTGSPDGNLLTLATASLAHLVVDISRWSQLRWGGGQLKLLISAKVLRDI